jgi:myb proto-oncogene protein
MSLQLLKVDGNGFDGYRNMNFMPPPPLPPPPLSQLSLSNAIGRDSRTGSEIGFQILSPSLEYSKKPCDFQPLEKGATERDMSDGFFGDERKGLSLKFGEEEEGKSSGAGKSGHTKLCARGHWRPAEDAKLKELVAQYGPQNWNLIAENLDGRSGNTITLIRKNLTRTNLGEKCPQSHIYVYLIITKRLKKVIFFSFWIGHFGNLSVKISIDFSFSFL